MVSIVSGQPLIGRNDGAKAVMLMTSRVETNNWADVAHTTHKALWKPTFITLMTHGVRSGLTSLLSDAPRTVPRIGLRRNRRVHWSSLVRL
jgi:hypothetical protein